MYATGAQDRARTLPRKDEGIIDLLSQTVSTQWITTSASNFYFSCVEKKQNHLPSSLSPVFALSDAAMMRLHRSTSQETSPMSEQDTQSPRRWPHNLRRLNRTRRKHAPKFGVCSFNYHLRFFLIGE